MIHVAKGGRVEPLAYLDETTSLELTRLAVREPSAVLDITAVLEKVLDGVVINVKTQVTHEDGGAVGRLGRLLKRLPRGLVWSVGSSL